MSKLKTPRPRQAKRGGQNHNSKLKTDIKHRTYRFSLEIISFISKLPNKRIYWIISDQLLRCATSIGANIIEAKSSTSRREFIRYYEIALKSANETKYWLGLLRDAELVEEKNIENLLDETTEIANMIGSSLLTLKGKKKI